MRPRRLADELAVRVGDLPRIIDHILEDPDRQSVVFEDREYLRSTMIAMKSMFPWAKSFNASSHDD